MFLAGKVLDPSDHREGNKFQQGKRFWHQTDSKSLAGILLTQMDQQSPLDNRMTHSKVAES